MSLTTGKGPHGPNPAGRFHPAVPRCATYVEPLLRRVRAFMEAKASSADSKPVIDSEQVVLVHRAGRPPSYAFPRADVASSVPTQPEPAAQGYVQVPWDAVSAWYEEETRVLGHPMNPYHRIDCLRAQRQLRVTVASALLVDTTDVVCLYETSRLPQLYVRRELVRMDLLHRSATVTYCPYKGSATHWTASVGGKIVPDVAWSYDDPYPESAPIAGLLGFYPERVSAIQDVPGWFEVPPPTEVEGPEGSR